MHILFTGVGRRIELLQAFRNAALVLNKDLKIYGADMSESAPALAYCDFARKVCPIKDPHYIDALMNICKKDHIDLVIPTIDTDLIALSYNRERFEKAGTRVLISTSEMVEISQDKNETSRFFNGCGLHTPIPVNDWTQYKGGYPAFIKPKNGSSSINAFRADDEAELKCYANQIDDYLVQPYIAGTEYTIDIFCGWNGVPLYIVPRERVQVRAGEVLVTRICMDQKMIDEAKTICEAFKPCGPITVQVIRDQDEIDWFIEINSRYGGGAPLSMKAGARSAEAVLKLIDGEAIADYSVQNIADGAIYSRFDQSVCVKEGNREIKGVIFDLDDTLYSEKEYVQSGFKAVSEYLGCDYDQKLWEYFESGKPAIDALLKDIGRENEKDKVLEVYRSHKPIIHLYEGVVGTIQSLKNRGMKIGIITDGRPEGQRNKIKALGLEQLVDDIIVTDELGGVQFRKPCDIAFRIIQTKWKMNPAEIVYVGDNPVKDFQAARQLGMSSVCYYSNQGLYSSVLDSDAVDCSMGSITDIIRLI